MRRLKPEVVAKREEIFREALEEVHGASIKVISAYRTMNEDITVKCEHHGIFVTTAKRLIQRKQGCPGCANVIRSKNSTQTRRLIGYDKAAVVAEINNWKVITKRSEYGAAGGKISFECSCGYVWQQTAKVAAKAKNCRRCANNLVNKTRSIPIEKRLAAIDFVHDGSIVVTGYKDDRGEFECTVCGSIWKTKLSLVAGGSSCFVCASKRVCAAPKRIQYQIELCGKIHYVVGYEAHAIRWLLTHKNIPENAVDLTPPVFTYRHEGKTRRYIPDFKIGNNIVEVKSHATAGLLRGTKFASFSTLKRKARAVERAGYKFVLMLMQGEKRIHLPKNWMNMTAGEVISYSASGS